MKILSIAACKALGGAIIEPSRPYLAQNLERTGFREIYLGTRLHKGLCRLLRAEIST
jgi:hypothetical protein